MLHVWAPNSVEKETDFVRVFNSRWLFTVTVNDCYHKHPQAMRLTATESPSARNHDWPKWDRLPLTVQRALRAFARDVSRVIDDYQ